MRYCPLTAFWPARTVDSKRQVALFMKRTKVVEDHAIGAKPLRNGSLCASVVFIALYGVGEEAIRLGTFVAQAGVILRAGRCGARSRASCGGLGACPALTKHS